MNLRDAVGKEGLPPMPRQEEALIKWILEIQSALVGQTLGMNLTSYDWGMPASMMGSPNDGGQSQGGSRGGQYSAQDDAASEFGGSEAGQAYDEAKRTRMAAMKRNQGQGIF
jgi:hypothetical protein